MLKRPGPEPTILSVGSIPLSDQGRSNLMPMLLPTAPRSRPYTEADLDALLEGRQFTFDDLAAALVLVVPPLEALSYLRGLAARRALTEVGVRADGTRELNFVGDRALAAC